MLNLIFDLGANNGCNINYYLTKAKKVVAVEANPVLCSYMKDKYPSEIKTGKLVVLEACLTTSHNNEQVTFYINKFDTGLSRFLKPTYNPQDFNSVYVNSISYDELIKLHGEPDFVKIDLEGYDKILLEYIIKEGIMPKYLSTENPGYEMLVKITQLNYYKSYNIVSFYNYKEIYKNRTEQNRTEQNRTEQNRTELIKLPGQLEKI